MRESVVIIENGPDMIELVSLLFERQGLKVYTARDRTEGVNLATVHQPEVIAATRELGVDTSALIGRA